MAVLLVLGGSHPKALAQTAKKRLPNEINIPTYSHICPSLSGDGRYMVFLSNYTNEDDYELKYSTQTGPDRWEKADFVQGVFKPTADHFGSYSLSYDGRFLLFSSARANGIGRYDIWMSERVGKAWGVPRNLGKPLNSAGNEGDPSLSADGRLLYFTRCSEMDLKTERGCKIYVAQRRSENLWGEPQALPAPINMGNETAPHIMADGQTLIFSSDRPGGKGKKDLYLSRQEDGRWDNPVPLDFLNTERNDEFVSVPAHGEVIYYDDKYKDQWNIYKAVVPEALRPKKVMMLTGTVAFNGPKDMDNSALVQAYDVATNRAAGTVKVDGNDGGFFMALPEGAVYDFSVFPLNSGTAYYSKLYDLTAMNKSAWEKPAIELKPLKPGASLVLGAIRFENYSSTLKSASNNELKRIAALLQKNPGLKFEIDAYVDKVNVDSIPAPDLTEQHADTTFVGLPNESSVQPDTLLALNAAPEAMTDSSSLKLSAMDSLLAIGYQALEDTTGEKSIFYQVKYTYSNDRTQPQAQAIVDYLVGKGVPGNRLVAKGCGDRWATDRAEEERDYWVELKVLPPQ